VNNERASSASKSAPIKIEGFRAKRAYIAFWADFGFFQDRADFWQTGLFRHGGHRSVIVFVDLRFVFER